METEGKIVKINEEINRCLVFATVCTFAVCEVLLPGCCKRRLAAHHGPCDVLGGSSFVG